MNNQIHLQGIGKVQAIPAKELKIGTVMMWNYGYTSEVLEITPLKSGKTIRVKMLEHSDNKEYMRDFRIDSLVAITDIKNKH